MNDRLNKVIMSIFVLGLFLIYAGTSYSLIDEVKTGAVDNIIIEAKLNITGSNGFNITNDSSKDDDPVKFILVNTEKVDVSYKLYIEENEDAKASCLSPCEIINKENIKYILTKESTRYNESNISSDSLIDYGIIKANTSINYSLKVWKEENTKGTAFYGNLRAEGVVNK